MAVTQDVFTQYGQIGFHGQQNSAFPAWIDSQHAEGSDIGFGVAVVAGTADDQSALPATGFATGDIVGVTLRSQASEVNSANAVTAYAEDNAMSVLKTGRLYLTVSDGATRGGPAYVVVDTGEIVSTAGTNVLLTGAKWVTSAGAGEVAELEIK